MKRLSRFQLRDRWLKRETIGKGYFGDISLPMPAGIQQAVEYAWLMGYNAREAQDARRRKGGAR